MTRGLVDDSYVDAYRIRRRIAPDVRAAVLAAMGLTDDSAPGPDPVALVRPGQPLPAAGDLTLEDGTALGRHEMLPPDVPFGYHHLEVDGSQRLLITGPGRCHLPPGLRSWGWTVQLATTRSRRSWGIGDLDDLRALAAWASAVGAGFVAVSPLGAPNPGPMPEPSPYYPSTRRFGNPLHLAIEGLPGGAAVAHAAEAGRALNDDPIVDRRRVLGLKLEALERSWAARAWDAEAFATWRAERGTALERWATFAVLTERFGPGWRGWPRPFRSPDEPAVAEVTRADEHRVAFHAWIQWCFDRQLAAASEPLPRIADMPVGSDPGGFDAWDWQEQLAIDATVGAPPDRFNQAGQDWGLPPFIPHRLREAHYRPFIDMIQAQLRHAGGLRIDHVLGLFRLWWIPAAGGPERGAYVRYPTDELLEIVALESERAGAIVIGEDLGTVPPGVRRELHRRRMLSTRLALFERQPPHRYPRQAVAGATTHDLPTIAGVWSGVDLDDQAAAGIRPDTDGLALLRARLLAAAGTDASLEQVVLGLHRALADSPSALVAATLEDALRVERRPNMPGTVAAQRPNWSMALPLPIEELGSDRRVAALVAALERGRR